jgi:hypothetical protein
VCVLLCCRIPPGTKLWAPVMGVPGRGLFVQWSNGEVSSGSSSQHTHSSHHSMPCCTLLLCFNPLCTPHWHLQLAWALWHTICYPAQESLCCLGLCA